MNATLIALLFIVFGFLVSGTWIALSLLGTAGISLKLFTAMPVGKIWSQALWNSLNNWALAALPMFIFLGEMIQRTRMSKLMFEGLRPWVQFIPGRLIHINILGSTIFAAVSGSSPATAATIGKITLQQLEKEGYDKSLSYGSLAGAGTLGLLIPPSIVMIIYGVLGEVSIGRLFIAGILPGLILAGMYSLFVAIRVIIDPSLAPTGREKFSLKDRLLSLARLAPVSFLILFILGSIYSGFATPTEAAAIGALGGIVVAALLGDLTVKNLLDSMKGTINTSAMICFIIAGASFLSVTMGYLRIPATVAAAIGALKLSPYFLMLIFAIFYVILGCFLDGISMIVMTLPITLPLAVLAGFDPVWFGIFLVLVIEAGQITPPVGFNLFVLQGLTGQPIEKITMAAFPFFLIIMLAIVMITVFPDIVMVLPDISM
jgi:tripartite ATP-independent transporter DctM subunit